jgi:hypothetical protein
MKAQRGEYSITLLYPKFRIRWRQRVNAMLLHAWKSSVSIAGGWVGSRTSLDGLWQRENPLP